MVVVTRGNFRPGAHDTFETEWYQYKRKDGKLGAWHWRCGPWYTPLFTCNLCERIGAPKNVCIRNDCCSFELWNGTPTLCTGCWNKVKPVINEWRKLQEMKKINNKIRRAKYDGAANN